MARSFAKPFQSKFELSRPKVSNDPQQRFARSLNVAKDAKKLQLLKEYDNSKDNSQCCQSSKYSRFSKRETEVNQTTQNKPATAHEDAFNDNEVTMTTKAVEDLLTDNVSSEFPLTDKPEYPDVSNTDQSKYPLQDSDDNVLKTLLSNLMDGRTDHMDNLFKDNIIDDPESDSFFLPNYYKQNVKDNSGLKSFKPSSFNKVAKVLKNKPPKKFLRTKQTLLGLLLQYGLTTLQSLLTSKTDNSLDNSQDLKDNQILSAFKFPSIDKKNCKNSTDKEVEQQTLLEKGLKPLKFPWISKSGKFLKNGKDLLKALATILKLNPTECDDKELKDGDDLNELKFPLLDRAWEMFKNKTDLLPGLLKKDFEPSNCSLIDAFREVLDVSKNMLATLFDKNALSKLQFPKKGSFGEMLENKQDLLHSLLSAIVALPKLNINKDFSTILEALIDGFKVLKYPLTDATGGMLKNTSDVFQTLLKCSPDLAAIQFPLADVAGKVLETKQALLAALSSAKTFKALQFPLSDCAGKVFKSKLDFLRNLLKGVTKLYFPLTDAMGNMLTDVVSLLDTLLQSCTTLLKPAGGKLELLSTLLKGLLPDLLTLLKNKINVNLLAGNFPLNDIKEQVKNLVEPLLNANSLSDLMCPISKTDANVSNSDLMSKALPLTAAVEFSIKTKLELLLNLIGPKSLEALTFPLNHKKGNVLKNMLDLIQTVLNDGLASIKFPLMDATGPVLKDKSESAELSNDISPPGVENRKVARSIPNGIFKLLNDKEALSELGTDMFMMKKT